MDKRILGTKVYARGILRHFGAFYTGEGQSREKSEAGRVRKELTVDDCDDCTRQGRADSAVRLHYEFPEGMHKRLKVMEKSSFSGGQFPSTFR